MRSCRRQVPNKEARMLLVSLPRSERAPPLIFLPMKHSTRWRSRYKWSSYERGCLRLERGGMTAAMPMSEKCWVRQAAGELLR